MHLSVVEPLAASSNPPPPAPEKTDPCAAPPPESDAPPEPAGAVAEAVAVAPVVALASAEPAPSIEELVVGEQISNLDRWFVTNGVTAVGPVSYELLRRGVESGRIPAGSFVRHDNWKVWRRLEELEQLSPAKRDEAVQHLSAVSQAAEERASNPYHEPPPPPTEEELAAQDDGKKVPSLRPAQVDPSGVLENATDLEQAMLLALSTAVTAAGAHVGFLHLARPDLGATVTSFAHGPDAEVLLGERLAGNDPVLLAAQAGHTVMGEPRLGEAGRYIAGRMTRCMSGPRGVAMVPVLVKGHMAAMIEVGRASRPFRATELAKVEEVAEALAVRIVALGWN